MRGVRTCAGGWAVNTTWLVRVLAGVLALALAALIARNTHWEETEVETPASGEALKNPYYGFESFVHGLGISTQVAATLQKPSAKTGVLFAGSVRMDLLRRRIESLEPWVEGGGHLVIGGMTMWDDKALQSWSGVSPDTHDVKKPEARPKSTDSDNGNSKSEGSDDDDDDEEEVAAVPLQGARDKCESLEVSKDAIPTGEHLSLCGLQDVLAFKSRQTPTWSVANTHGIQSMRLNIGRGTLTILPRITVGDNWHIRKGDHAKLILAASGLQRGDRVLLYQPSRSEKLLPMLWRIAAPGIVVLLAAVLLIILRQLPRFGTQLPAPLPLRRSLAEQIRAQAAFAWRTRKLGALRRAARRALDETGSKLIASYRRLNPQQQAALLASASGVEAGALAAAMTEDAASTVRVQRAAIAMLQSTRRSLLQRVKKRRKSA
jgi:hypothetical protein